MGTTEWDPNDKNPIPSDPGINFDPCATLFHEMQHLADYERGTLDREPCATATGINVAEVRAVTAENRYRATQPDLKDHLRTNCGNGTMLPPPDKPCLPHPPRPKGGGCNVSGVGLAGFRSWAAGVAQAEGDSGCAVSNGDPHLTTFDGLAYDFQGVGEFIASRSDAGDLEVQVRQSPFAGLDDVSVNLAVALNMAGDRVGASRRSTAWSRSSMSSTTGHTSWPARRRFTTYYPISFRRWIAPGRARSSVGPSSICRTASR